MHLVNFLVYLNRGIAFHKSIGIIDVKPRIKLLLFIDEKYVDEVRPSRVVR